jgi:hypothetical protein
MTRSITLVFVLVAGALAGCSAAPASQEEIPAASTETPRASQVKPETTDPCASTCDDMTDPFRTQNCACCRRIVAAHHYIDCYQ